MTYPYYKLYEYVSGILRKLDSKKYSDLEDVQQRVLEIFERRRSPEQVVIVRYTGNYESLIIAFVDEGNQCLNIT